VGKLSASQRLFCHGKTETAKTVNEQASAAGTESEWLQTEEELIWLCQQGDRACFRLLYQRYQQKVRSTLYQLCGATLLDDLVQEVFLKAFQGLPKLKTPKYFATWLYRISWNVATDRRRKLAKNQEKTSLNEDGDKDSLNYSKLSEAQDTPDLMHLHYQDLVQRGLNNLSFEHRAVLVLHDLEDLPQKQVAEILDVPVGTIKSRLFHARNSLKKFLEQQGISL
jgi:RNA polymerase sigma-70 factor (ECF subfamily)